jgi:2-iminobutanoate/2-iminopropanoate deaminase
VKVSRGINLKREVLTIPGFRKPNSPFSHVVSAGGFLFLTSQLSSDLVSGKLIGGSVEEQTRRALTNIRLLLEAAGSGMENVVKTTVYMRDVSRFEEMNSAYREYFTVGEEPARVTVQAPSPIDGIDIEIDVIAVSS